MRARYRLLRGRETFSVVSQQKLGLTGIPVHCQAIREHEKGKQSSRAEEVLAVESTDTLKVRVDLE